MNIRDSLIHIDQCLIKGKSFRKIRHENGSIFYYSLKYEQEAIFNLCKVKEIIDLYNNLLQPNNKKTMKIPRIYTILNNRDNRRLER